MKLGIVFPRVDIGTDPAVAALGVRHLCLSPRRGVPAMRQVELAIEMKRPPRAWSNTSTQERR